MKYFDLFLLFFWIIMSIQSYHDNQIAWFGFACFAAGSLVERFIIRLLRPGVL